MTTEGFKINNTATWIRAEDPVVRDHVVHGVPLMPGVTFLDLMFRQARMSGLAPESVELHRTVFREPLSVSETGRRRLKLEVNPTSESSWRCRAVSVLNNETVDSNDPTYRIHAESEFRIAGKDPIPRAIEVEALKRLAGPTNSMDTAYSFARRVDICHAGFMKAHGEIYRGQDFILAELSLNEEASAYAPRFLMHPTLLDAATLVPLQLLDEVESGGELQPFIPLSIQRVRYFKSLQPPCFLYIQSNQFQSAAGDIVYNDLLLLDAEGNPCVLLERLAAKRIRSVESIQRIAKSAASAPTGADQRADNESESGVRPPIKSKVTASNSEVSTRVKKTATDVLIAIACEVSGLDPEQMNGSQSYFELGLESAHLMDVVMRLERGLEIQLYPTLLFEYTHFDQLADYLNDEYGSDWIQRFDSEIKDDFKAADINTPEESTVPSESELAAYGVNNEVLKTVSTAHVYSSPGSRDFEPIAIIGMSGKFPRAQNLEELWERLAKGEDCIEEIPGTRWDHSQYYDPQVGKPGKTYGKWGGFVGDVDRFDPLFFNIAPLEAEVMDPQERMFLENVYSTMESAGYTREALSRSNGEEVGVFVGAMWSDYQMIGLDQSWKGHPTIGSSWFSSIANRVSYFGDFHGPSLTIDTACSGSLLALHLACQSLHRGECTVAFAGGVNVSVHPSKFIKLAQLRMLSTDGRCRAFGAGGNGYVPGEGVGSVLLKPLSRALQDGDAIRAVILGSATNHGGHTSGYTVPSSATQAEVIRSAWHDSDADLKSVGYIETHGTGTALGDPIEVEGLRRAFEGRGLQSLPIGSVKSNLGHLESAAGIASLIKTILQMERRTLVPSIHTEELNPHIDFEKSIVRVQRNLGSWDAPSGSSLRAGVSSFGAGGSCAHVALESGTTLPQTSFAGNGSGRYLPGRKKDVVPVSAKHPAALQDRLSDLLQYLNHETPDWHDFVSTLQSGRETFSHRWVVVADSVSDFRNKLGAFLSGEPTLHWTGKVSQPSKQTASMESAEALAEDWTRGMQVDWQLWRNESVWKKIALPTYPFRRERCWIEPEQETFQSSNALNSVNDLKSQTDHPVTISPFSESATRMVWNPTDLWLKDHQVQGKPLLPGSASLAWALQEWKSSGELLVLEDWTWNLPVDLSDPELVLKWEQHSGDTGAELKCLNAAGESVAAGRFRAGGSKEISEGGKDFGDAIHQSALDRTWTTEEIYGRFEELGLGYGPAFQTLRELRCGKGWVEGDFELQTPSRSSFETSARILDAVFQSSLGLFLGGGMNGLWLPHELKRVTVFSPLPSSGRLTARLMEQTESRAVVDFQILNLNRDVVCQVDGLSLHYTLSGVSKSKVNAGPQLILSEPAWRDIISKTAHPTHSQTPMNRLCVIHRGAKDSIQWEDLFPGVSIKEYRNKLPETEDWEDDPENVICILDAQGYENAKESAEFLGMLQNLLRSRKKQPLRWVTVIPGSSAASGWIGLLKTAALERPRLDMRFLRLASAAESVKREDWKTIWEQVMGPGSKSGSEFQWDEGQLREQRWVDLPTAKEGSSGAGFRKRGVYWITGGVSGIGWLTAQRLASVYHARLVLTGRRPINPEIRQRLEELHHAGGEAIYVSCDVERPAAMKRVVQIVRQRWGGLNGALHSAGIIEDSFLISKNPESFHRALGPKVRGTQILDEVTSQENLDLFILFASLSGVHGNAGQADYSMANRFQMEWAQQRKGSGKSIALAWPFWAEGGMQIPEANRAMMEKATGMQPLSTEAGMQALETAIRSDAKVVSVLYGKDTLKMADWLGMEKSSGFSTNSATWSEVSNGKRNFETQTDLTESACEKEKVVQEESTLEAADLRSYSVKRLLRDWLTDRIAAILKVKKEDIDPDAEIGDYGFDSITLSELARQINDVFDIAMTPADVFEFNSANGFVEFLIERYPAAVHHFLPDQPEAEAVTRNQQRIENPETSTSTQVAASAEVDQITIQRQRSERPKTIPPHNEHEPIAIVGMAGVFPGAENIEAFTELLESGGCAVGPFTVDPMTGNGKERSSLQGRRGGFIQDVASFDAAFFHLSPKEAAYMDPQHRVFLETAWAALEHAGIAPDSLAGTSTGVFVGVGTSDYTEVLSQCEDATAAQASTGNAHSVLANRLSFLLDLRGPSEPVDTACSSSLVALHRAIQSMRSGDCDLALVGGVNLMLTPTAFESFDRAGMLAPDGLCKPFDHRANGYVRGEGCGVVALKPLSVALQDGSTIYATVRGTAVNHGGHAKSLTAPNPQAQAVLIETALNRAGVSMRSIGYLEAHGTGTALGDPIEINAIKRVIEREKVSDSGSKLNQLTPLKVGSVKSNIGHLETAAGIAGLIKAALSLHHRKIFPSLHVEAINPLIDLKDGDMEIATQLEHWNGDVDSDGNPDALRAGVSSFGFGGVNAHAILESNPLPDSCSPRETQKGTKPQLLILSARTPDRLRVMASRLEQAIRKESVSIADVAYTLQVGRNGLGCRWYSVVSSVEEACSELGKLSDKRDLDSNGSGCPEIHEISSAQQATLRPVIEAWKESGTLDTTLQGFWNNGTPEALKQLGALWSQGVVINWETMVRAGNPRRIGLPTYPFERRRIWAQPARRNKGSNSGSSNTTTSGQRNGLLKTQSEAETGQWILSSDNAVLVHHKVLGTPTLPGAWMVAKLFDEQGWSLEDVNWIRPVRINDTTGDIQLSWTQDLATSEIALRGPDGKIAASARMISDQFPGGEVSGRSGQSDIWKKWNNNERMRATWERPELYREFESVGIRYGKTFQRVRRVDATEQEWSGVVDGSADGATIVQWLDAVFQTAYGLQLARGEGRSGRLPATINRIVWGDSIGESPWVVDGKCLKADTSGMSVSLQVKDARGVVVLKVEGLQFLGAPVAPDIDPFHVSTTECSEVSGNGMQEVSGIDDQVGIDAYTRVWTPRNQSDQQSPNIHTGSCLLIHSQTESRFSKLLQQVREKQSASGSLGMVTLGSRNQALSDVSWEVDGNDPERSAQWLADAMSGQVWDRVIWLGDSVVSDISVDWVKESTGLISRSCRLAHVLFNALARSIKKWTFVTRGLAVIGADEKVQPQDAALNGWARTLSRERPDLDVACLDVLDLNEPEAEWALQDFKAEPGITLAFREGRVWFQELSQVQWDVHPEKDFPKGRTWLIAGGMGGIGFEIAQRLIQETDARVALLGRRALDESMRERMMPFNQSGERMIYAQADLTQKEDVCRAVETVRTKWGAIHCWIHSALGLKDSTIARMNLRDLDLALDPKIIGTLNLFAALESDPIEKGILFSSANAILCNPGQANYVAACVAKDAIGQLLNQRQPGQVTSIQWGYWGEVGIVANQEYRQLMERQGIRGIGIEEGWSLFRRAVCGSIQEIMPIHLSKEIQSNLGIKPDRRWQVGPRSSIPMPLGFNIQTVAVDSDELELKNTASVLEAVEIYTQREVAQRLNDIGIVIPDRQAAFVELKKVAERWGSVEDNADTQKKLESLETHPVAQPYLNLLRAALKSLPDILSGKCPATEALFPDGSPRLVEGVYQGNPWNDYFNRLTAEVIVEWIQNQRRSDDTAVFDNPVRILEVGGGTGSTTRWILKRLDELTLQGLKIEYTFSDLSSALTQHGRRLFEKQYPWTRFKVFNIEKSLVDQDIQPGSFDLVLGANVFHATHQLRHTLAVSNQLLRPGGALVLNEITEPLDFLTSTFGLLDGWRMYQDPEWRTPGGPLLSPEQWMNALGVSGFGFAQRRGLGDSQRQSVLLAHSLGCRRLLENDNNEHRTGSPYKPAKKEESLLSQAASLDSHSSEEDRISEENVRRRLTEIIADQLGFDVHEVDPELPFSDFGVDSIMAMELVQRMNQEWNLELNAIELFNYTCVNELARYLRTRISIPDGTTESTKGVESAEGVSLDSRAIAIIGMSGRFPGAEDMAQFWENLKNGVDAVGPIPKERWDVEACFDTDPTALNRTYSRWGGMLKDPARFAHEFFGISGTESKWMDPQQKVFLEEAWKALEDAGYSDRELSGKSCGVYVGVAPSDFTRDLQLEQGMDQAYAFLGNAQSILAARIAYQLNLRGPALAVDTACSSTLTALHLGCEALWQRQCEMALVGGVHVSSTPQFHILASKAGMLSPTGRCRTFDAHADGFVPSEGVGAFLLKPLAQALADGDAVHGVIIGSGLNQDGRSNGLTAPSTKAQIELERQVYRGFGIDPRTLTVVETHGTGTRLGDPIEFEALTTAFREQTPDRNFCALGAVKSFVGHGLAAAGVAGLAKALLQMRHRMIPGNLHYKKTNPALKLETSPFYIPTQLTQWNPAPSAPLRAALSSFGFSGSNAHLVLEEAPVRCQGNDREQDAYLLTLSAKDEFALRRKVNDLEKWLSREGKEESLYDIAWTANFGRSWGPFRLAFVVRDREELSQRLQSWDGKAIRAPRVHNNSDLNGEVTLADSRSDTNPTRDEVQKLANDFLNGRTMVWRWKPGRRVHMPTYPFHESMQKELSVKESLEFEEQKFENQVSQLSETSGVEIKDFVFSELCRLASVDQLDPDQPLEEIGFDSIMGMHLIQSIESRFGLNLYANELAGLDTMGSLVTYVQEQYSLKSPTSVSDQGENESDRRCEDAPVFLLSTPRAGSTLLRVMLSGHPGLFCPPEMHLAPFDSLQDWEQALQGKQSFLKEGLMRTLMELGASGPSAAQHQLEEWKRRCPDMRTVYDRLRERSGGKRVVDKSPSYAESMDWLKRTLLIHPEAQYIHLVRHPLAVAESFVRNRFDRLLGIEDDSPQTFATQMWLRLNENILHFFQALPENQKLIVQYESLVRDPETECRRICDFLKISYDPAMIHPYQSGRMTDGVHASSIGIGDPNFLKRQTIESDLADAWRERLSQWPMTFSPEIQGLADRLGYDLDLEAKNNPATAQAVPSASSTKGAKQLKPAPAQQVFELETNGRTDWWIEHLVDLEISGGLSLERLSTAWSKLVEKHSALRMRWDRESGLWSPVASGSDWENAVDIQILETGTDPDPDTAQPTGTVFQPFNPEGSGAAIDSWPYVKIKLMQLGKDKYRLYWNYHHFIGDGVSSGWMFKDLARALTGRDLDACRGKSLTDYMTKMESVDPGVDLEYWRRQMDRSSSQVSDPGLQSEEETVFRDIPVWSATHRGNGNGHWNGDGVPQSSVGFYTMASGLYEAMRQLGFGDSPVIAHRLHGRRLKEWGEYPDLVGFLAYDVPVEAKWSGINPDAFQNAFESIPHGGVSYPLLQIKGELPSPSSLAKVRLNFQPFSRSINQTGISVSRHFSRSIHAPGSLRQYLIDIAVRFSGERLYLLARHTPGCVSTSEVEQLLDLWVGLIREKGLQHA